MTKPVVCHKGKCEYEDKEFIDDCYNCNDVQEVENVIRKNNLKK